jgi:hypothetical protein
MHEDFPKSTPTSPILGKCHQVTLTWITQPVLATTGFGRAWHGGKTMRRLAAGKWDTRP